MKRDFIVGNTVTAAKAPFENPKRTAYVYFDTDNGATMGAGVCEIPPASSNSNHVHEDEDEVIYVLKGRIRFQFPEKSVTLCPFEAIYIPRGLEHQIFNDGDETAWHTFTFNTAEAAARVKRMYK